MKSIDESEALERVVPMSFIKQGRKFACYTVGSFVGADLVFWEEGGGYKLRVFTADESLVLASSKGGEPRTWRSTERALLFLKKHFGPIPKISVVYPLEN